ncbi:MAG: sensor histidine kinase [Anaerostipes sp.]|uniref:sensor histidine kinase n=1 Tax=Anaerostipes sp. TaxID=1872530 RepID=UPI00399494CB
MSGRKNILITIGFVLSVSLMAAVISVLLTSRYYNRLQFDTLNEICGVMLRQEPESEKLISMSLKEYTSGNVADALGRNVLSEWGYEVADFSVLPYMKNVHFAIIGFLVGIFLFIITFLYRNRKETLRIRALAEYLEWVNTGKAEILSATGEDDFSKLEDEIYKTVTFLYQTKDKAVQAKNNFAENLYNIAHQIKTPITAISLSLQTMGKENRQEQSEKIQNQLLRLTRLEEGLLLLSRFDAGTLVLQKSEIDVLTVIVLAADNLQELLAESGTSMDIPELGEMAITADLEWTMEAVINLMKNCMEHNRGGTIHCTYGQNPLYTEILIWDEGNGFDKEDIPHLFERFYRGKNACTGGIGIGLALAKEIIERQNGTIHAKNMPEGGACFEIRFYCH